MSCSACHRDRPILAKGLCSACYQRLRNRGTTDPKPRQPPTCTVDGCDGKTVAKSLCDKHYRRLKNYQDVDGTARPDSWGAVSKHPLRDSYNWIMRHRGIRPVDERWHDFLQFIADVGKRPSPEHRLMRIVDSEPIGPDNFYWKEPTFKKGENETRKEAARRYQREYRKIHPKRTKHAELAKSYGLSLGKYEEMLESQQGKCAICGVDESVKINGKTIRLSVDHCHETGKIRGLLCSNCNRGIGHLKDDVEILKKAIAYLENP